MNGPKQPEKEPDDLERLRAIAGTLWLFIVAAILWIARAPYQLREIEARECEPDTSPTLSSILSEFISALNTCKLEPLKPYVPRTISAKQKESLEVIIGLTKENVKDGFDRLDSIEKKMGVLFTADGLLISLCSFLIGKEIYRIPAIALLAFLLLALVPLVEYYRLNRIPYLVLEGPLVGDDCMSRLHQLFKDYDNMDFKVRQVGNYLADLFTAARRFVCCALGVAIVSGIISVCWKPKDEVAEKIPVNEKLIGLLQEPRGEPEPKSDLEIIRVIYITNTISGIVQSNGL